jgi:hypothetical protein
LNLKEELERFAITANNELARCAMSQTREEQRMHSAKAEGVVHAIRYLGDRYEIDTSHMLKEFEVEARI